MKNNNKNKKGLTAIEALIALSLSFASGATIFSYVDENNKKNQYQNIVNGVDQIMYAFDQRFDLDGFNAKYWNTKKWETTEDVVDQLIKKEFHSKNANKCSGSWEPINSDNDNLNLVDCDLWSKKIPMGFETEVELKMDINDFVSQAILYIKPKEHEVNGSKKYLPEEDFKKLNKTLMFLKARNNNTDNGSLFFDFYSKKDDQYLTKMECLDDFDNCSIKGVYSRLGDSESLYTDGSNSMIDSSINFIENNTTSPLECIRWIKDSDDNWILSSTNNDCGIGIYNDSSLPIVVETSTHNGTFENIVLEKECNSYVWNSTSKTLTDNGVLTPCGMSNDGTEVFQIVDNTKSLNLFSNEAFIEELEVDNFNVDDLITESISSNYVTTKNKIEVLAKTSINNLHAKNLSTFNGDLSIRESLNILFDITFEKPVTVNQELYVKNNFDVNDINTKKADVDKLESLTTVTAKKIIAEKHLDLVGVYSENQYCETNGSIGRDNNGDLLNCISNKWLLLDKSELVGTIMAWGNATIPDGWIECNGQSTSSYPALRAVVGSYVPDLRGRFIRGYQSDNGRIHDYFGTVLDAGRGFKSYQADQFKAHNHTERSYSGEEEDKGGSDGANDSKKSVNTGAAGGAESRPENIALMYIIKAE